MQTEIDETRKLAAEAVEQLATKRRERKAAETLRDADESLAEARKLVAELEAPFRVTALKEEEAALAEIATEVLVDFDVARKAELIAGRECAKLACPDGVRIDWRDKLSVPDANQLPIGYQKVAPKTKEITAALKRGETVRGASFVVAPVVVVGEDESGAP